MLRAVTALSIVPRTFFSGCVGLTPTRRFLASDHFLASWLGLLCLAGPGSAWDLTGRRPTRPADKLSWRCGVDTVFVSNKYREIR